MPSMIVYRMISVWVNMVINSVTEGQVMTFWKGENDSQKGGNDRRLHGSPNQVEYE
jgi:hypothetical protein